MGVKFLKEQVSWLVDKVTCLVDKVSRILNFIESKFGIDLNTPKAPPNSPGPISPEPLVRLGNSTRVFIGGLSLDTRERDVQEFCSRIGDIIKIVLKSGFCFVVVNGYKVELLYEMQIEIIFKEFENVQDANDTVNA